MTLGFTFIAALLFFIPAVGVHLAICRLVPGGRFMLKGLLTGFFFSAAAGVWSVAKGHPDAVLVYLVLSAWLTYMMFFINLMNSITLKMLEHLAAAPRGELQEAGFREVFNAENGIRERLEDMRANAFISLDGKALRVEKKASRLLWTVMLIRKIFSIDVVG